MRKPERKWWKAVATRFFQAMTLIALISAVVCRSQNEATACFPENGNPPTIGNDCGISFSSPMPCMNGGVMAPNTTSTMYIRGSIPTSGGCPDIFLFAADWDGNMWSLGGAPDPYVSLSNFQYLSPTLSSFTLSIGGAPPGNQLQIQLYTARYSIYTYDFSIEPPAPPMPPAPSQPNPNCPTITIASVTPSLWMEGVDNPIIITGSGFTSAPEGDCEATQVSASVPISNIKIVDGSTITAVVTPPAIGPAPQPADRRVASPAVAADTALAAGNTTVTAYLMLFGTGPAEGSNMAWTTAQLLPPPTIYWNGNPISKNDGTTPPTQNADVGWQINLTTTPTSLPYPTVITSSEWSVDGTNIGGYTPTPATPASYATASVTPTATTQTNLKTYWVFPTPNGGQNFQVKYHYCVGITGPGNPCSADAIAIFNVKGPKGGVNPDPPQVNGWSVTPVLGPKEKGGASLQYLMFALGVSGTISNWSGTSGISFDPSSVSNVPSGGGTINWVQLLLENQTIQTTATSTLLRPVGVGLDNRYFYPAVRNGIAYDSPATGLQNGETRVERQFMADMYEMWTSSSSKGAAPIPVPLGYVQWQIDGTAVLKGKSWFLNSNASTSTANKFHAFTGSVSTADDGYPTWTNVVHNK